MTPPLLDAATDLAPVAHRPQHHHSATRSHAHGPRPAVTLAPTPVEPQRPRSREGATRDLATRHLQGVSTLLQSREDLRGVHAFADVVEESVRWSA